MRRRLIGASLVVAAAMLASPAQAERIVLSISRHQVMVTSNFTGTQIVLFGTIEPDTPTARRHANAYDVVATIYGPRETLVTWRKERMFGIWVNRASRTFVKVPTYLAVLANKPFQQIADTETLRRLQIGLDYVVLTQQIGPDLADVVPSDPFRSNFVRLKKEHHLYVEVTNGVTFLTPTVFRAEIPLPADAPIGNYDVDVKVLADGAMLVRSSSAFEIVKAGFEQFVANSAREHGLLYGLATTMMALLTGWLASIVFRRD